VRRDVKEIGSMQSKSLLPKPDAPVLPCPAHAPGYGEDHKTVVPDEARAEPGSETPKAELPEKFEADRALHAMAARLTGGISPVALSLAFIDWASHLALAPQRQMEIVQDGLRSASQFSEAALHLFSPGQRPWSLIEPRPQDRLCQPGMAKSAVQSARPGVSAEGAMVA
jgi:polyhydroxyalkanoate synthase subunit PhaC